MRFFQRVRRCCLVIDRQKEDVKMKKYVKPEIEIIKLRIEERIASCANDRLKSEFNWFDPECNKALPIENFWTSDCYDLSDCS